MVRICLQCRRPRFDSWVGKIPWKREWLPTPVFWPGEFHGLYSPWGHKELDATFTFIYVLNKINSLEELNIPRVIYIDLDKSGPKSEKSHNDLSKLYHKTPLTNIDILSHSLIVHIPPHFLFFSCLGICLFQAFAFPTKLSCEPEFL